jgi:hypothetical protein
VTASRFLKVSNPDFSTPEGAVLALEQAYRDRDIEAAVAAKDFERDAYYFLRLEFGEPGPRNANLQEWASSLERNFRNEIAESGFRDYTDVTTSFTGKEIVSDDEVVLTQHLQRPDAWMELRLVVVRTPRGWRTVLAPGFDTL